ncbi:MAG TPA: hypothetical protein VMZ91_14770 [Candidatus Paceibacterota bacterium]|nr:hypothetical protein [Candidatus Paceibacterota bacterium]
MVKKPKMKGKEYLKNKEKVLDMRKSFEKQKVILADCYYWKDVYEALRLEKEDVLERLKIEGEKN